MIVDRRSGLGMIAAAGLVGTASNVGAQTPAGAPAPVIHHVFFWLKRPDNAADRTLLIEGLKTLRAIPQIRALHVGVPAPTEKRSVVDHSFAVSELMFFDNVADQKSYQDHPIHQRFVATCGDLWSKVVVYDAIDV